MLVPSSSMRALLAERLQEYGKQFLQSQPAMTYWESRGLTKTVAEDFCIGFVERPLKGDGRFKGRLAIPYLTPSGPVSFKFRLIDAGTDRFSKDKGDPARIFNTRALLRASSVILTEGEIDCVAASQAGLTAVGIPGATVWKSEWSNIFLNREVTVLADGDDAGYEFAEKVAENIYNVRIVDMPQGEDVCSMLQSKGEDWIRGVV